MGRGGGEMPPNYPQRENKKRGSQEKKLPCKERRERRDQTARLQGHTSSPIRPFFILRKRALSPPNPKERAKGREGGRERVRGLLFLVGFETRARTRGMRTQATKSAGRGKSKNDPNEMKWGEDGGRGGGEEEGVAGLPAPGMAGHQLGSECL